MEWVMYILPKPPAHCVYSLNLSHLVDKCTTKYSLSKFPDISSSSVP
jgi:hypothetical protein